MAWWNIFKKDNIAQGNIKDREPDSQTGNKNLRTTNDAFTLDELSLFAKQLKELDNCDEKNNTIHTVKQYMQKHFPTHTTTSSPSLN